MMKETGWLSETQAFFFEGVRRGWAGGNNGLPICDGNPAPGLEDWREVVYREPLGFAGFELSDRWGTDPDSKLPSGHIFISHWGIPVWGMWVGGGAYDKEVFPFLQKVLANTYRSQVFFGGRGLPQIQMGDFLYTNEFLGDFTQFRGREKVEYVLADGSKKPGGFHNYWGGSLVFQRVP